MEERVIKIDLATAKEWYNKGGELREVALQAYKEEELAELPKTWLGCYTLYAERHNREYISDISTICQISNHQSKYTNSSKNCVPVGLDSSLLALCQLLICREVYRQGWKPDWNDGNPKSIIKCVDGEITMQNYKTISSVLAFKDDGTCIEFLKNFRDLIEEAKRTAMSNLKQEYANNSPHIAKFTDMYAFLGSLVDGMLLMKIVKFLET